VSDPSDTPTGTAPRRSPATGTVNSPADPTAATPRTPSGASRLVACGPSARFMPGTVLADRYRIVGLLGRGGMGEVYRADDLKLEQPVALKFLSETVEADAERLARFYNEARLAREVTHPAVYRVHDIAVQEVPPRHSVVANAYSVRCALGDSPQNEYER
jgi:serine/threonine protein kinase